MPLNPPKIELHFQKIPAFRPAVMVFICASLKEAVSLMVWANNRRLEFSLWTKKSGGYEFQVPQPLYLGSISQDEIKAQALDEYLRSDI